MPSTSRPSRRIASQGRSDPLEGVWKALGNTDRRRILDLLREAADLAQTGRADPETAGGLPTGDLVMALPHISRFAVMQHLKVLQAAGLVVTRRSGRLVLNYLNAVPIRMIYERWVNAFEGHWASSLISLKGALEGKAPRRSRRPEASGLQQRTSPRTRTSELHKQRRGPRA